jgi:hypothetical protein
MKDARMPVGLIGMTLLFVLAFLGQNKPATPPPASAAKAVSASGYVTAGVEAGCLMLQDSKTKTLYNLFFVSKRKPTLGAKIHFSGTRHDGPTTCMQGEAVDVQKWSPLKTQPGSEKNQQ